MAKGPGPDLSLSLLQNLLFTAVAVFAYVTVYAARVIAGGPEGLTTLPDVPENLVIMMGLSVVTAAASKGITVSYLNRESFHPMIRAASPLIATAGPI